MSEWDSARVCDVCEQVPVGTKYSKELVQDHGNIKVIDQSQADIFGWHNNSADIYASPESPVFTFANHTCSMRWMDEPFSVIQNVFPMRGIPGKTDTRFLYYASGASVVQDGYKGHFPQFRESIIQIPPLPEQKKIAEILSGIDEQIMSVKSEIQQARKISTAVTKDLIGTIQDESLPLSKVAVNHDSIRVPIKSEERALRSGPYRYFGASGIIDTINDFLFDGDYILIGEDGANIIDRNKPLAFKVSGKFWVNNHAHIIQPRESCDINFLTYYLESLDYTGIASGSAQPKITRSALDAIQVPIPPLEVQKKIGAVIESAIDMATTAEKKEKKLIDLKQALSYDLLSGRKRVSI
jgi:type I restriction enzyme S subunit